MELSEVAAREAIRELVARYAQHADRGRFDDLVALFAEDGVLQIDDRDPLRGREAVHAFLGATRVDLRQSPGGGCIRHHVTTLSIDVTGPDDASGAAYFMVVTDRGLDHWGRYRDRYRQIGGVWRFTERRVRVEGAAARSWAAERRTPE